MPPPVPPKDCHSIVYTDVDRKAGSSPTGSKRKRSVDDDSPPFRHDHRELSEVDALTPKRTRPRLRQRGASASEDAKPDHQRNVRRKRKSGNLSSLNLRHAADSQAAEQLAAAQARESRFQEGSLTDKPSEKPPSIFTRFVRAHSGKIRQVDELMEDFHNEFPTLRDSGEVALDQEVTVTAPSVGESAAESAEKVEGSGLFKFGRLWTTNFHPVTLWNKLWAEAEEELTREAMEEAERKARLKAEAEAKYAEMKKAGQILLQPVGNLSSQARTSSDTATPRDSAVMLDSARSSTEHKRTISVGSQLLAPPKDDSTSHSGSDVQETADKRNRGLKSRFHFKRPSMLNLKEGLKRVTSDLNLAAAARRESSSSVSPVKTDFDGSTLTKSQSKYDLKHQSKLSKRVSDLEVKLQQARKELDEALIAASPMPKLGNKHEKFTPTPTSTIRRPKFVPGALPSLPSERILMAEQLNFGESTTSISEVKARNALDLTEELYDHDGEGEDTIKAARVRNYPARASSLFEVSNGNIERQPESGKHTNFITDHLENKATDNESHKLAMDPNSVSNFMISGAPEPSKPADYASLDAKLKSLDTQAIAARKSARPKKRKSGVDEADKLFKPAGDEDDDDDLAETNENPKKKRKSAGKNDSSPLTKRRTRAAEQRSSPRGKKVTNGAAKTAFANAPETALGLISHPAHQDQEKARVDPNPMLNDAGTDELAATGTTRNSLDSQGTLLGPVYEEEEDTPKVPLEDDPSRSAVTATPAYHGRQNGGSRSMSPDKRVGVVRLGIEETMITRAAEAAQNNPARLTPSVSPPPANGFRSAAKAKVDSLDGATNADVEVRNTSIETKTVAKKDFQWPPDCF